jgi:hypothetical protein
MELCTQYVHQEVRRLKVTTLEKLIPSRWDTQTHKQMYFFHKMFFKNKQSFNTRGKGAAAPETVALL